MALSNGSGRRFVPWKEAPKKSLNWPGFTCLPSREAKDHFWAAADCVAGHVLGRLGGYVDPTPDGECLKWSASWRGSLFEMDSQSLL